MKKITILILPFLISGCASIWPFGGGQKVQQIEIQKKEVERVRLDLPCLHLSKQERCNGSW
jgi:hypothetical protein